MPLALYSAAVVPSLCPADPNGPGCFVGSVKKGVHLSTFAYEFYFSNDLKVQLLPCGRSVKFPNVKYIYNLGVLISRGQSIII